MFNNNNLKLGLDISKIDHIISRKMDNEILKSLEEHITMPQAYAIDFIATHCNDKDIFQKDLEKEFDLKRSSITHMLNNMERNNLIKRVSVPEDARLKKIILTDKALKSYEQISFAIDCIENKLSYNISNEEIDVFHKVLSKIRNNLE